MAKRSLVLSLGLALVFLLASTALALKPPAFQGKPAFKARSALGAYVWHDSKGLHARFTTRGKVRNFTGKICTPKKITKLTPVKLERVDSAKIGAKGHSIHLDLKTAAGIDGVDFRASGKKVTFHFKIDGKQLKTNKIRIGTAALNPKNSPFVLDRN